MKNFRILLCTLLICSCRPAHPYLEDERSFIAGFYEFNEIMANWKTVTIDDADFLRVDLYIPKAHLLADKYSTDKSVAELYKSCCIKHNDYSSKDIRHDTDIPKEIREIIPNHAGDCCYPVSDFVSVSITANKQWDDAHPEGSSLDGISHFAGISPNQFFLNSYKVYDPTQDSLSIFFNNVFFKNELYPNHVLRMWQMCYPIDKKVVELNAEDLKLLGPGEMAMPGGMGFEEPDMLYYSPDVSFVVYDDNDRFDFEDNLCSIFIPIERDGVERSLTVTLTDENGTDYSTTVTIE